MGLPGHFSAEINTLGYQILSRQSELLALRTVDIEFRVDGTLQVLVRMSKLDLFGEGRLAFTSRETADRVSE